MTRILSFDEFYGRRGSVSFAHGFAVVHRAATVPARRVVRHTHADAHFVLALRGAYACEASGAPDPGEPVLVYNPPVTRHRDRFLDDGASFFTVSVTPAALQACAAAIDLPDVPLALGPAAREIATRLARAAGAGTLDDPLLESLGLELLSATATDSPARAGRPPSWLRRVREHLHDECITGPSLQDLAWAVDVHPVHLTRAFRRAFGRTPGEYLRRCRLQRAAAMLADGETGLAQVAVECGFFDQAHLGRCFRDAFGVTPGAYRRRWRPGADGRFSRYKTRTEVNG